MTETQRRTGRLFATGYAILYVASLAYLHLAHAFPLGEALIILVVAGAGFSAVAWLATRGVSAPPMARAPSRAELASLAGYIAFVSLYLVFGKDAVDRLLPAAALATPASRLLVGAAEKLLIFVALPWALFVRAMGRSPQDCGVPACRAGTNSRGPVLAVVSLSAALLVFQYFLGGGAAPVRRGELSARQLAIGLPIAFLWLVIEVGLVEEFFFRGILQARLESALRSSTAGALSMGVVFGLSHVPGLVLRNHGGAELLSASPSWPEAAAYSVVILSVGSLFLGVVWARTRNLLVLILVHAAGDLLPNAAELVKAFGIR